MIRVQCPRCAWQFAVEGEMLGRQDRCPKCATPVPVTTSAAEQASAVSVVAHRSTVIRTPLAEVDDRLRPEFDRYLNALAGEVQRLKIFTSNGPGVDLIVPVTLEAGGRASFTALVQPIELMPDSAALAELFRSLFAVRTPITRGPAAEATLIFAVRGGSGQLHAR